MTRSPRWRGAVASTAIATVAALAACAPGSPASSGQAEAPSGAIKTDPAKLGKVQLVVWDQLVRGGQKAQITQLNKEFQRKYPNIDIKRVSRSFEDLKTTLKLALSGENPPDVVQANNGRSDMGAFVEAGMLTPLDRYAKAYGWAGRYPESVLQYSRYTSDAKTFGKGHLYGLPQAGEFVGVFYNKAKLAKLGIEPPQTWADFESALAEAKSKGMVPIQFGNLDQWPAIHTFGTVQSRYVPQQQIADLGFGRPGASWTTPENREAASALVEWAEKGYFTQGFNGLGYDQSWQRFTEGEGVFLISGTWLLADLQEALGEDLGFMLPPSRDGQSPMATGGTGLPFAVTSKSEHPDAAAAYIDFVTSEHAMKVIAENGGLPAVGAAKQQAASPAQQDIFQAWDTVTKADGLVPYLDYATPTFYDTLTAATQNLLAKKLPPQEYLQDLQQDYEQFVKSGS